MVSLIGVLTFLSTVPGLNVLSLGYLLEASGRIVRSGRWRDGLIGIRTFARIGSIAVGTFLMLVPLRFLSSLANDADLAAVGSPAAKAWRFALFVLTIIMLVHIATSWFAGGKLRHFFWPLLVPYRVGIWLTFGLAGKICRPLIERYLPLLAHDLYAPMPLASWFPPATVWEGIRKGNGYLDARDAVWEFLVRLRLPHYFWLGLRGYAGALLWLAIPSLLLLGGTKLPPGPGQFIVGWIGAIALMWVVSYLPFLQAHFAAENRWGAMFERSAIKENFRRAPLSYWLAMLVTVAFAIPLYLFNIENILRGLIWIPGVVFVVSIYPARLLAGWVVGYGRRRQKPSWLIVRWTARLGLWPVIAIYVLIVYLSQFTRWYGEVSFFEQHAFLLPVPFLGL